MTHSYWDIVRRQTFTLFNAVNLVLALLIAWTGAWQNMFFVGTVLTNWLIGMIQEIRARRTLNQLALLHQDTYHLADGRTVTRDGLEPGMVVVLEQGDQVPCDGTVTSGSGEVDESQQTGESEEVQRTAGDRLLSGMTIISGRLELRADATGDNTRAAKLMHEARSHKKFRSPLRDAIDTIVRFCTIAIIPCGVLLFVRSLYATQVPVKQAINSMAAALIGMIPEGLVVLTSIALAVASVKLAKEQVLVQQLYCSETLARTDVLCLDKTGTLTQGKMTLVKILTQPGWTEQDVKQILAGLYAVLPDSNATAVAIRRGCEGVPARFFTVQDMKPFASATKFSKVVTRQGTWCVGALSNILADAQNQWAADGGSAAASPSQSKPSASSEAASPASADQALRTQEIWASRPLLSGDLALTLDGTPAALLLLQDPLKPDVRQTVGYFRKQGVDLKVISGDDPATVQAIANEAGITGKAVSMQHVGAQDIPVLMQTHSIFGRVTPDQKKAMVQALQVQGHVVAMTGDGVNDVLALKAADCSIAMGSGSQAARAVSSMILLNNQFDDLPGIVVQGRRVINNIQRTASLFLVKTLFSFGLTLLTLVFFRVYPFEPVQLSVISALATGIPSFVLTLEPNDSRVQGSFLKNVLSRAVPGAFNVLILVTIARLLPGTRAQFSTMATLVAGINALWVLFFVCQPMTRIRAALVAFMAAGFVIAVLFFGKLMFLVPLDLWQLAFVIAAAVAIPFVLRLLSALERRILKTGM
ncbi:HAD-IC family P-type ATPase [Faecalibaculum rodentium]|uniref:HAD-IC family P-type ATPase n=2 Tax=Faecalibaculum rodentium TaxID=1702221 RepID=UPI0025A9AFBB|nr:HAD-IC family P-type ATPase [Faecalibaculum rodentium]